MNAIVKPDPNSLAALQAELAQLKAQNAALTAAAQRKVSLKVSDKGAVSVYGMGRFPVTLYASQWTTLLDMQQQIRDFIKANESKLATKNHGTAAAPAKAA